MAVIKETKEPIPTQTADQAISLPRVSSPTYTQRSYPPPP